jgi:hypothetical protein
MRNGRASQESNNDPILNSAGEPFSIRMYSFPEDRQLVGWEHDAWKALMMWYENNLPPTHDLMDKMRTDRCILPTVTAEGAPIPPPVLKVFPTDPLFGPLKFDDEQMREWHLLDPINQKVMSSKFSESDGNRYHVHQVTHTPASLTPSTLFSVNFLLTTK